MKKKGTTRKTATKRRADRVAEGRAPHVIVIGGPNGAGKTTSAKRLLNSFLRVPIFVNADVIAQGLSGFDVERAAIAAGRVMWQQLRDLAAQRFDFAFETTLASRTFAPWIRRLTARGYELELFFVWLQSPDLAIERIRERVRAGGHAIPEETIRRRYGRGVANFLRLYRPLASRWTVVDNSRPSGAVPIACGRQGEPDEVIDAEAWSRFLASAADGPVASGD